MQLCAKFAETSAYRERLAREGLTVAVNTPEQMTQFMRAEEARWRNVVIAGKVHYRLKPQSLVAP